MSLFEEAVAAGVKLPQKQREQLAEALGLKLQKTRAPAPSIGLPMASSFSPSASAAWRKAESGHAVLADDELPRDEEIPAGAEALAGIWKERSEVLLNESTPAPLRAAELPQFSPVVVHYDLCLALACGEEAATQFFAEPPVEIRLATAGYLALLHACENRQEKQRVRRFVQPFAVLSLGPMASTRAVELMQEHSALKPLDALSAATALAHEIPLIARDAARFAGITALQVGGV